VWKEQRSALPNPGRAEKRSSQPLALEAPPLHLLCTGYRLARTLSQL
jgi:hypothetical protein